HPWHLRTPRIAPVQAAGGSAFYPEMAKATGTGGASSFPFNNLTRFTPGKTGQVVRFTAKSQPFVADSSYFLDDASQPRPA
ncbi:MAG: hypothetical protein O2795_19615, partial [Acidobacteria bacterium]|nr:hypothetical protein [Acidobacteriota bacterium]